MSATRRVPAEPSVVGKPRMEALSDGLYAIAQTLLVLVLVLELKLPALPAGASDAAIRSALLPKGLVWMLSFWVIVMFWLAQQRLYRYAAVLDATMPPWCASNSRGWPSSACCRSRPLS